MDNANDNQSENNKPLSDEPKMVELTPELQEKLKEIQQREEQISKPKKNVVPLIAVIIVLLLISTVAVVFAMNKGKNTEANKNNGTTAETSANEETEVSDSAVKTQLTTQLERLLEIYFGEYSSNKRGGDYYIAQYMFTKNDVVFQNNLSDDDKLFITINSLHDDAEKVTESDYTAEIVKKYYDFFTKSDFLKNARRISKEKVEKRFSELFGGTPKHGSIDECGAATQYSADTGYYYVDMVGGCGGISYWNIFVKKLSYKKTADEFYIDAKVSTIYDGSLDMIDEGNNKEVCAIFNTYYDNGTIDWKGDMSSSKIEAECENGATASDINNLVTDIVNYRFVFDSEYHFKKVEKL